MPDQQAQQTVHPQENQEPRPVEKGIVMDPDAIRAFLARRDSQKKAAPGEQDS